MCTGTLRAGRSALRRKLNRELEEAPRECEIEVLTQRVHQDPCTLAPACAVLSRFIHSERIAERPNRRADPGALIGLPA
jgi:hypothetical protein